MGRFSCLVVVLVAACADNAVDVPDESTDGTKLPDGVNTVDVAQRLVPSVCGVSEWPMKVTDAKIDLSVAGRANGAAIVSMPIGGGTARGMLVDARMRIVRDETIATGYDKVSVSYAANRYASTASANGNVAVSLMADDLSSSQLVTSVAGNVVAKPAFYPVGPFNDLVMPVGGDNGLTLYRFADSFEPLDSRLVVATNPVESVTAAQFGSKTLAAWSTAKECFVAQISGLEAGDVAKSPLPCANPRLAVDPSTLYGILVYDGPSGATMRFTQGAKMFETHEYAGMAAPRALFDGKNFWMSYINLRGDVVVGIIDAKQEITSIGLEFTRPYDSSYELAMVEGSPWIFALDANGYSGHRLCVAKQ